MTSGKTESTAYEATTLYIHTLYMQKRYIRVHTYMMMMMSKQRCFFKTSGCRGDVLFCVHCSLRTFRGGGDNDLMLTAMWIVSNEIHEQNIFN